MTQARTGTWMIAGSSSAVGHLEPLIAARRARQPVEVWCGRLDDLLADPAGHLPADVEGLLVVGPRRRSPRRVLPGLFLRGAAGRSVPVGWLPDAGDELSVYAGAAARVLQRPAADRSLVVLGQWEDRFLRSGLRAVRWVQGHDRDGQVFQWTAERISRTDVLAALRKTGPALAMYFGHGRPRGWAGYHGVRDEHFERPWTEPTGALLALCCENASRFRTGMSFAERLVLSGVCGGMLAAASKTLHADNRRLGPALCEAYTERHPATLAELVAGAQGAETLCAGNFYRFIGDPLARLAGAERATELASGVFAPAADDPLPPWEETG